MLIPLGFLGAGGATSSFELISTVLVGSTTASVTFSDIPQTYKHLQIRAVIRGASGYTSDYARMRLNGSNSLYAIHQLYGYGSGLGSNFLQNDSLQLTQIPGGTATANMFGAVITDLLDYTSTNKNKTIKTFGGSKTPDSWVSISSGLYLSTSAVTSLTYYAVYGSNIANAAIAAGSRISLYGIKG